MGPSPPSSTPVPRVCLIEDIENVHKVTWTTTGLTYRIAPLTYGSGCVCYRSGGQPTTALSELEGIKELPVPRTKNVLAVLLNILKKTGARRYPGYRRSDDRPATSGGAALPDQHRAAVDLLSDASTCSVAYRSPLIGQVLNILNIPPCGQARCSRAPQDTEATVGHCPTGHHWTAGTTCCRVDAPSAGDRVTQPRDPDLATHPNRQHPLPRNRRRQLDAGAKILADLPIRMPGEMPPDCPLAQRQ